MLQTFYKVEIIIGSSQYLLSLLFLFLSLFFLEVLQCRRIEKFTFSMDQRERMQIDQLGADCFMGNLCFFATLATLQHSGYFDVDAITSSRVATFFAVFFSLFLKSIKGISDRGALALMILFSTTSVTMNPPETKEIDIKETYHNIPFLPKLASLDNCPNVNLNDVKCAKFLIPKLYGKNISHYNIFSK